MTDLFFEQLQNITREKGRPLILGHRGAPHLAPENSLESFRLAFESGADGIELDVQRSSDGVLLTFHDDELSNGDKITDVRYADLVPQARATGFECPRVAEVFHLSAGRGFLNIELKSSGFEAEIVRLAKETLPDCSYAFSSFDTRAVRECRRCAPEIPAFLIVFGPRNIERDLEMLKSLDGSGIAFQTEYFKESFAEITHAQQIPTFAWTVNDVTEARRLAAMHVQGIITDIPAELLAAFKK